MVSQTKENVKRKRKVIRKRRRVKVFRLLIALVVLAAILFAAGWLVANAYQWANRTYNIYAEMYDDYRQRRELRAASFDPRFDGYTNLLLVGLDPGQEDNQQQADSILFISLNNETGAVRGIIIPRYTITNIEGIPQPERLNNAYQYGGVNLLEQTVAKMLQVTIHHYVVLDTNAVAKCVDAIGGIDIYVEADMHYEDPEAGLSINIPKGYQSMNGDIAQKYLRYSSDDLGALGRAKRQQTFFKAYYNKLLQPDTLAKLPALTEVAQKDIKSSIEVFDSAHFTNVIRKMSNVRPQITELPGYRNKDGSWNYDKDITAEKMAELFPIENTEEETTEVN